MIAQAKTRNPYRSLARLQSDDWLRAEIHLIEWCLRDGDDLGDDDRQILRWQYDAAQDELIRRWERGLEFPACTYGFTEQQIERIKTAWPIEAVIGRDVDLKPMGQGYRGRCPVHNGESSTSLHVLPGPDGWFYCHGCHIGGDAITWIMTTQGVEFTDALRLLAVLVGEPFPMRQRPERKQPTRRVVYR